MHRISHYWFGSDRDHILTLCLLTCSIFASCVFIFAIRKLAVFIIRFFAGEY
ncbi:hypothetical protein ECL_04516 [Enterobacter cloacae subsp. cloacae ATCC 13047]|uniref:Uncharacterized protein n=1 Tax=Enterobacter cloacae subsp. cloacae (strain ATCC 13047 / DSM 30054 / NBRC 13535 / NCTC 10005 / WDCM 00083 / NCDC 279-56) TaxID=716541 RepID=A0A0H3CR25_ENTCC|nr:hypothetical protein ECL_04516 [Enterobacter cloacae subsp. cloacae ATCC 13047]